MQNRQTAVLDFTLDEVVARPGWLRHVSRRGMRTGATLAELAVLAGVSLIAARAAGLAGPAALLVPAAIILAAQASFHAFGLYAVHRLIDPVSVMRPMATCWTLICLAAAALPFLAGMHPIHARWLVTFYAAGLLALVVTRWGLEPVLLAWVAHGHSAISVAIVGANDTAAQLIRRLRRNRRGIRVTGVYDDRRGEEAGRILPLNRVGAVADLAASPEPVDLIVITLPLAEAGRIAGIAAQLRGKPARLRILPGPIGLDLFSPLLITRDELPGVQLIEIDRI